MLRYQPKSGKTTMLAAAAAATLALAGLVDALFAPSPTSFGAKVEAAYARVPHVEIAIVPSRIEVVGERSARVDAAPAATPRA